MWFIETIKFILGPILTESRKAISLTRLAFIYVLYLASNTWNTILPSGDGMVDIPTYQVITLFVLLAYMVFKNKAVDLINKFLDTLVILKSGGFVPPPEEKHKKESLD